MERLSVHSWVVLLALSLSACVHQTKPATVEQPGQVSIDAVFTDATSLIGKKVSVRGFLRWTVENRNLFPVGTTKETMSSDYCLPVLIKNDRKDLSETAKGLDNSVVLIDGVIASVAPPGMISNACKQVGVAVTSIHESK